MSEHNHPLTMGLIDTKLQLKTRAMVNLLKEDSMYLTPNM